MGSSPSRPAPAVQVPYIPPAPAPTPPVEQPAPARLVEQQQEEEEQQSQPQQHDQQHQQPRTQQQEQRSQPQQHEQQQQPQHDVHQQPRPHEPITNKEGQLPPSRREKWLLSPSPQREQQHQQPLPQRQPPQQQHVQHQQPRPAEPLTNKEGQYLPPSRRETWLLSPFPPPQHDDVAAEPSIKKNNATLVKANETHQSKSSSVPKPLIKETKFPHNYENILKDADSTVDKSSREKLLDQLYAGVFLNHKTKKYWVDKKSNANCFMLYARAFSITWGENQNYWKWIQQKDASGTITLAELENVCWLEVHGKFDTRKLSPGISYQVSFVIMLKDPAQGWEVPVNVRLVLPGGKKQHHKENLIEKLKAQWIEIPVGEFVASEKYAGEMEISMYEYEGGMWKRGLIIKGVAIRPKD